MLLGKGGLKTVYEIYVRGVQGDLLKNAIFKRCDRQTREYDVVAKAREATLDVDMKTKEVIVNMRDGYLFDAKGANFRTYFQEHVWSIPLQAPEKDDARQRDTHGADLPPAR